MNIEKAKLITANTLSSPNHIERRIISMRGVQVMLDRDLAELYGIPVKRLNEQVSRNIARFPKHFMFQLDTKEFATSSWGGVRKCPRVFTEQGVAMLSSVLNSQTSVLVSIAIMDAFVKMRQFIMSNAEVVCRMNVLEKRQITTDAKVDALLERHQRKTAIRVDVFGTLYKFQH